ncbi:putative fatty acyl-CoA reductase CG5065 [Zootermopsis nevadensis]|uniref:putative fatty acyl-CoA reductase CG5065 n=1 Tax=Zootermopsis nevadensis TaxID=136037 RepID=UPI000B8E59AE|nr:putative fatty acyl-CoA reductase CG5065 [Zootermopsis nevadensis]
MAASSQSGRECQRSSIRTPQAGERVSVCGISYKVDNQLMGSSEIFTGDGGETMHAPSDIPGFFKGRCIFITGGTGFMGKVLVEKLLRSCPEIATIYLLMRPKRGNDVRTRHEELIRSQIFDRLRNEHPGFASQLVAVRGDITLENLGVTPEDKSLIEKNVSVVFHCAANVRFDQKLNNAVRYNTLGTKRVLELAKHIDKLDAFVHVSTAYCQCDKPVLEEITYPSQTGPDNILQLVEWMDDEVLDLITPKLLGNLPNTYAYSKNLTEQLVTNYGSKFPTAIARPSIVTGTWKDPIPGWVENLNGPTGLLVGAGKGVIRSMHCRAEYDADILPCDMAINALIILAWKVASLRPKQPLVCNLTVSGENPITWGHVLDVGRKHLYENPLSDAIWFPDGSIKSSWLLHTLCVIFFHFLPAYLIDFVVTLFGKKPFMVKIQRRIQGGLDVLQYYTTKEWVFRNDVYKSLSESMTERDRETFYTDVKMVNWDGYIKQFVLGTRHYCLKEDPATLPEARRRIKWLYWMDRTVGAIFYMLILWMLLSWSDHIIAWGRLTIRSVPQMFSMIPILRTLSGTVGPDAGTLH